jgi:TIGR03009 family protein
MTIRAGVPSALAIAICWIFSVSSAAAQTMPLQGTATPAANNGMAPNSGAVRKIGQLPNTASANGTPSSLQILPPPVGYGLTPVEENNLNQLLADWEKANNNVKTFYCKFKRLQYDPAIVGGDPNQTSSESSGELEYAAPDKGMFKVEKEIDYSVDPKTNKTVPQPVEPTEWWTCDGKSTFAVVKQKGQLYVVEKPLPPEMQGKAISEGPLPFVFGAKADALKKRYYLRIVTPPQFASTQIWLEAFPKLQKDAANFSRVDLILNKAELQPVAIQISNPGANNQNPSRVVIMLDSPSINNPLAPVQNFFNNFAQPNPLGAKHVLEKDLLPPSANPQLPVGAPVDNQASRPKALAR